ncbi:MAG: SDR family oxidoreductase [Rhodospirillales bacterium]|nr:SDR family oxidoreductase [Rhodospirillales bacterium]
MSVHLDKAAASRRTILVTGGAGFIGSHLCERLLERGDIVWCLDNNSTGSLDNVGAIMASKRFRLIDRDIIQPLPLHVDEIYNLACPASPAHYQADPIRTTRTCVLGALNVLDLAHRCGARVLQASTSEIYGEPEVHPQRETYWGHVNPIGARACYDEGKRCAESLFFDYHRSRGVAIRIARIFNTYGPRMQADDGRIVSNFIVQALRDRPLTVYGDGRQTRSFCYVRDMVDALIRLMDAPDDLTGPMNLGNPHEVPVIYLADRIIAMTGASASIVFKPLPPDDPSRRRPDIGCARRALGWEPVVSLEEGLAATVDYFRAVLQDKGRATAGHDGGRSDGVCGTIGRADARLERPSALHPVEPRAAGGAGARR